MTEVLERALAAFGVPPRPLGKAFAVPWMVLGSLGEMFAVPWVVLRVLGKAIGVPRMVSGVPGEMLAVLGVPRRLRGETLGVPWALGEVFAVSGVVVSRVSGGAFGAQP
ncbi:hypothetical protein ACIBI9_10270 [Nonomuraea sp. NPDC050451]|uniref:hypothetical protein n=1 Tax=Nonomuraea sp. NPDC050451 TaxID=3364364 RepID=UPI0037B2DE61